MITCKEDLYGTYVLLCDKEAAEIYVNLINEYGISSMKLGKIGNEDAIEVHKAEWSESGWDASFTKANGKGLDEGSKRLTMSDLKPTKQYAVLHKGGSYSFQSDKPIGNDVVACFDLERSEKPLSDDFFDEKPRTKFEYVKVTDSIFDLKGEFEGGWLSSKAGGHYVNIDNLDSLLLAYRNDNVYRKVETEIDERQEFIDAAIGCSCFTGSTETELTLLENMFDSGKFKLVN